MIGREEGTPSLWDRWFVERLVPPDHLLMRIDRTVDFRFVEEEARDLYLAFRAFCRFPLEAPTG